MNEQSSMIGQSQIMQNQNYVVWAQPRPPLPPDNPVVFQGSHSHRPVFNASTITQPLGRINRKGNKSDKRKEFRRNDQLGMGHFYKPSNLNDLQSQNQNRLKARRFHQKKKFNNRFAPFAPRNTSSFIIRAKKSGGIASLVSPCPVTPAVLPTPIFSPSREVLVDTAKEEWGVDGYGSMKGLIRLRSPKADEDEEEEDEEYGGGSTDSDVEEHVEVERRLDHDLSRFEMIYPRGGGDGGGTGAGGGYEQSSSLENRVDDQDAHIAQLEDENLTLKERMFLMERELDELRRRVQCLETKGGRQACKDHNGEAFENGLENNEEVGGDVCSEKSVGNGDGESDGGNERCGKFVVKIYNLDTIPISKVKENCTVSFFLEG
ncbi:PRLI-interacting factor A [Quillaja saponaria]|uniref:PRLI-interacting factor A n=1 Tax=Quillaja saponaria TaxID=32244 RepID=A0AAD7VNA9_QUISA|nr:PRLI-interacting factor A [Quillaja saponaria]